jgi:hypothetical protein
VTCSLFQEYGDGNVTVFMIVGYSSGGGGCFGGLLCCGECVGLSGWLRLAEAGVLERAGLIVKADGWRMSVAVEPSSWQIPLCCRVTRSP